MDGLQTRRLGKQITVGVGVLKMVLVEYKPAGSSDLVFYSYDGNFQSVKEFVESKPKRIFGWILKYKDIKSGPHQMVVFGKDGDVYIDLGEGPFNFSKGEISFEYKKTAFSFEAVFKFGDSKGYRVKLIIWPWRYFVGDGMFPEDIEPLYAVLKKLHDPEEKKRLENELSSGIRFELQGS